jgi:hypothetical protein
MANISTIRCAVCEYAQIDRKASQYTRRKCTDCELNKDCKCKQKSGQCKCGNGCKHRGAPDTPCPKQEIKWAAYQCTNTDSEYHKSLLNVSFNGDMQSRITWGGCVEGERRCGR